MKIYLLLLMFFAFCSHGEEADLPYPNITEQYSFLVNSYFSSENMQYQYPILYLSGNIGSFLVLAKPLQSTVKPPEDHQFGSNPNINYTVRYYRMPKSTQYQGSDTPRKEDNKFKDLPLINSNK